ncbi:50S ribosomal protein L11 methyltransferase [Bradyrhizobium sp. U87765 SZCCT0131]|uniref:50S ribosomal protein L11 methyltransferase n=1 Tax=unclassified Bradyrhizobium TaxID=2631580 RepID=UPI001BA94161|nr:MULTISPECIES: 50S ribosomal protein L11 methyltransferase [unclassified Bradyrhizobium]MBR1218357.1 50S ribosomal protein L11 methyltransferase [Bradyrhizobium sp. U87765 SZCCT0131]MBR1260697.1 50S ribosomal protein L11 methyltransferase [Bradyrhizobium sp. U87765 SZCCT0134]MBR1303855.1 50S ribosomal protein L11 methyltransferase [Bradyrhizobium sp. U87765 SZCCT0110]MBR1319461.1 50S ribosomal protein L11 methyltransferase [Bradyrhizobium sp. U87765 SZCCT0109]MBR1347786.1 50S ribosomal prote
MNSLQTTDAPPATRASFTMADERSANRVVDVLSESFDNNEAAIAAFERPDGLWDVTLYFGDKPDETAVRALVELAADKASADAVTFDTVETRDWVKASLEGLAPVEAGRFIVHGQHDRARVPPNRIGIEIEAALAFGTGHHGTTRGCLLLLDQVLRSKWPRRVLDLGTGTGVLAIAAAKAQHKAILASDIDWRSAIVARENARLNGVGHLVTARHAPGFSSPDIRGRAPFDLVLANILANPLRRLATPMSQHLAPGAYVILSGLLPHQANSVVSSYRSSGLVLVRKLQLDGWTSLLMTKP